ncbi:MAG: ROK family protein, partial [Gemmatimonadaceae bacterium]
MHTTTARQRFIIGVDLGGTNIVVGAISRDGDRQIGMRSQPTQSELGVESVVDRIAEMVEEVIAEVIATAGAQRDDVLGVGIGAPGPLDRERGVVVVAPNLGWRQYPLRDAVSERLGLPATLDNDANCATLGEWWQGAARGARHVVGLTIGTGIGGGIIIDGKLHHGASDVAGEIGHTTIDLTGRYCRCGNYGCLEAYASGPAIAQRAREALERDEVSALHRIVEGDLSRLTAATVYEAAKSGDALARELVRDTATFLGAGIANLLNVFNPDVVVIAGGVTQAGEPLFDPLRAEVRRRAFRPAVDACRIVPGELPGTAGVVGAVATFREA